MILENIGDVILKDVVPYNVDSLALKLWNCLEGKLGTWNGLVQFSLPNLNYTKKNLFVVDWIIVVAEIAYSACLFPMFKTEITNSNSLSVSSIFVE